MQETLHHTNLLAGLFDNQVEFVAPAVDQVTCINNSRILSFEEFPEWVLEIVVNDMVENPEYLKELVITEINIESIFKYIYHMFGGLDLQADIDLNGKVNHSEYFSQSLRKNLPVHEGHITPKEINVLKHVALCDKQIAPMAGIKEKTVLAHWQNMRNKTGLTGKVELALWAKTQGII